MERIKLMKIMQLYHNMKKRKIDLKNYSSSYNGVEFDIILDVGCENPELLIGAKYKNWADVFVVNVKDEFSIYITDAQFQRIKELVCTNNSRGEFNAFKFFMKITENAKNAAEELNPKYKVPLETIMRIREKYIPATEEAEKTIFKNWNLHLTDGRKAHNFKKTELFFGKKVADYCRKHNISSCWTTPDKAKQPKNYQFPWEIEF